MQAIESQVDDLCDSVASSDDRVTDVVTKYNVIHTAVDVSMVPPACLH